jgi:hypothetical protein
LIALKEAQMRDRHFATDGCFFQWAHSYQEYIGRRNGTLPNTEVILSQFPSTRAYEEFVEVMTIDDMDLGLSHYE